MRCPQKSQKSAVRLYAAPFSAPLMLSSSSAESSGSRAPISRSTAELGAAATHLPSSSSSATEAIAIVGCSVDTTS
jgi:hypothetical protein